MEEEIKQETKNTDPMEEGLALLLKNGDSLLVAGRILDRLASSGLLTFLEKIVDNSMPSDPEAMVRSLDNQDVLYGISKAVNILPALLRSFSGETGSDVIKSVLYDSDTMFDSIVVGAKNPLRLSLLKIMAILKDEEVSRGLTAMLNLLKFLGKALERVDLE
jgi:uncharacterized protein YjgD (DUF1641 family)